jgi:hypothetical protein
MGWQIPAQIEQDIISGKAQYRTFQTGVGGQSILPVPNNAYAVIFGYDFSPAGGGLRTDTLVTGSTFLTSDVIRPFETQQISFYTGADFFPFVHHVNTTQAAWRDPVLGFAVDVVGIDNTPLSRQVYITSSNDVTITHGLIINGFVATQGAIPVTNRTPSILTYGGSGQAITAQTNFGPNVAPQQFLQPSIKDFQAFGLGVIPNNATEQIFAAPDAINGLLEASNYLTTLGNVFRDSAACNYFLCLHYALYTESVPEQRG